MALQSHTPHPPALSVRTRVRYCESINCAQVRGIAWSNRDPGDPVSTSCLSLDRTSSTTCTGSRSPRRRELGTGTSHVNPRVARRRRGSPSPTPPRIADAALRSLVRRMVAGGPTLMPSVSAPVPSRRRTRPESSERSAARYRFPDSERRHRLDFAEAPRRCEVRRGIESVDDDRGREPSPHTLGERRTRARLQGERRPGRAERGARQTSRPVAPNCR